MPLCPALGGADMAMFAMSEVDPFAHITAKQHGTSKNRERSATPLTMSNGNLGGHVINNHQPTE